MGLKFGGGLKVFMDMIGRFMFGLLVDIMMDFFSEFYKYMYELVERLVSVISDL